MRKTQVSYRRYALRTSGACDLDCRFDGKCAGRANTDRVSVARRLRDDAEPDVAARARPIVNDERLAEPFRHAWLDQPHDCVGAATGRKGDDDPDRLVREVRRLRERRCEAQTRCQQRDRKSRRSDDGEYRHE